MYCKFDVTGNLFICTVLFFEEVNTTFVENSSQNNFKVSKKLLPPFQIIRHSKNLRGSKHFKFDQNYRENYKKYNIK
jgi:hypothetical protein